MDLLRLTKRRTLGQDVPVAKHEAEGLEVKNVQPGSVRPPPFVPFPRGRNRVPGQFPMRPRGRRNKG